MNKFVRTTSRALRLRPLSKANGFGLRRSAHHCPIDRRMPQLTEIDGFFRGLYPVSAGTLAAYLGCSWNGRPSRDVRISPLEAGLTTLRLPSCDWSHAGLPTSPLRAPYRGLMPLR